MKTVMFRGVWEEVAEEDITFQLFHVWYRFPYIMIANHPVIGEEMKRLYPEYKTFTNPRLNKIRMRKFLKDEPTQAILNLKKMFMRKRKELNSVLISCKLYNT